VVTFVTSSGVLSTEVIFPKILASPKVIPLVLVP
jgi:hypothetical protein